MDYNKEQVCSFLQNPPGLDPEGVDLVEAHFKVFVFKHYLIYSQYKKISACVLMWCVYNWTLIQHKRSNDI